ncbi:hypothetical protein ADK75_22730 [Streptomyces virginiae]|uniref:Uncharacterized protein n=1 Tax=Streptomyces virginiae TaxID=1961 RepID=A0A0L8MB99_STRVG|nr:hypothetical protein [Streptomyces virginiae]KOG47686.1 hypothetical protein ADK75_22730 [Streptomyces virginiae]
MTKGQKATRGVGDEPEQKKLDLSAAQVAGSSLATVAAALLASKMGVYGTILGAGVVSVVATAGGPVIQHFFRRTGDQLRVSARTGARRVPSPREESRADGAPEATATGEFGAATVHGTRVRGWKRTAVASGAAFAIAIGGLGTYEAMAGTSVSSGGGTLFSGGTRTAGEDRPTPHRDGPGADEKGGRTRTPGSGTSPSPSRPQGDHGPSPGPSPSGSGGPGSSGSPGTSGEPTPGASPSKQAPSSSPSTAPSVPAPGPDASAPAPRQSTAQQ